MKIAFVERETNTTIETTITTTTTPTTISQ